MAYSFPPRGFNPSPVLWRNDRQCIPRFENPSLPSPRYPFQETLRPPIGYCERSDRPPFIGGELPFGPFSIPNPCHRNARGDERFGPRSPSSCAWRPDTCVVRFGAMPGRFPPPPPPPIPPNVNCNWVDGIGDITERKIWPGLPKPGGMQRCPGDSWTASKNSRHQKVTGGSSMLKNSHKGALAKKKKRQNSNSGNKVTKSASDCPEHCCDVCDRGFKTRASLDEHLSQHVKCHFQDCKFEAHAKIVKLHAKLQHSKGSKRITWCDTPSEVERWREERKKNYPSAKNITQKIDARARDENKGIVVQNKYFGKMRPPNWRQPNATRNHTVPSKRRKTDSESNGGFQPKCTLCKEDSGTEVTPSLPHGHRQVELTSSSNLGSLSALASYGGDSDDCEGEIIEEDSKEAEDKQPPKEYNRSIIERKWCDKTMRRKKTRRGTRAGKNALKKRQDEEIQARLKKRPNLLEMLLASEIRRERNIILQCVRHIVQNDFFGVNQTKPTATKPGPGKGFPVLMEENSTSIDVSLLETQRPSSGQTQITEADLPTEEGTKSEGESLQPTGEKSQQATCTVHIEEDNPLMDNGTKVDELTVQMQQNRDASHKDNIHINRERDRRSPEPSNNEQPTQEQLHTAGGDLLTTNGISFDEMDPKNVEMHTKQEDSQLKEMNASKAELINQQTTQEPSEEETLCPVEVERLRGNENDFDKIDLQRTQMFPRQKAFQMGGGCQLEDEAD